MTRIPSNTVKMPAALRLLRGVVAAFLTLAFTTLLVTPGWAETCVWRGTAPFCDGSCNTGETTRMTVDESDDPAFGNSCTTGNKVLCCRPDAPQAGCVIGGVTRADIADQDCAEAQQTGCIRHLLNDDQYANCLRAQPISGSGCLIAGVNRTDIADSDCQEAQQTGCIKRLLTKSGYAACQAAQPKAQAACHKYAARMGTMVAEAKQLNCEFVHGSGGWDEPVSYWEDQCNRGGYDSYAAINEPSIKGQLAACKSGSGGTTGTATVIKDVDVYDKPDSNGNPKGQLLAGKKVTVVGPCDDANTTCHVTGANVPGGDGYVYSGPGYVSLKF